MKILNIKIKDIKPYLLNAKKHPKEQIEGIAESIKRFGFTQPVILDKDNTIIIGHGRIEAAKIAGMNEVPCVKRDDLTDNEVKVLRLLDNRIAETGWDNEILIQDLSNIDASFEDFSIDFDFLSDHILQNKEEKEVVDSDQFIVTIFCKNESEQKKVYEEFTERGMECKLIM